MNIRKTIILAALIVLRMLSAKAEEQKKDWWLLDYDVGYCLAGASQRADFSTPGAAHDSLQSHGVRDAVKVEKYNNIVLGVTISFVNPDSGKLVTFYYYPSKTACEVAEEIARATGDIINRSDLN